MVGALKCQCVQDIKNKSLGYYKVYNKNYTYINTKGKKETHQICHRFVKENLEMLAYNNALKYIIIIINVVIRTVIIKIMVYVGCDTESQYLSFVTNVVFVCQFFNTGFLPMLCTANLSGQIPAKFVKMFNLYGSDSDFNLNWFSNIGDTIVGSMVFNSYFPIGMEFLYWGIRSLKRALDRNGAPDGYQTKCVSIQQYVNIYAGSEYFMHFKYSAILNIVFLTFCFGPGMPLLLPIATISFFILFTLENYMLHYVNRTPPNYDNKLNDEFLEKIKWAPCYMLAFGYWMITNPQLQQSYTEMEPIGRKTEPFINQHYFIQWWNPHCAFVSGPGGVLLLAFYVFTFYYLLKKRILGAVKGAIESGCCKCKGLFLEDIEVNEDIDPYQNCLDEDDRSFTVQEELLLRAHGMQC